MDDMAHRLVLAREAAGYERAADAAQAFGWRYSTYAGHENGSRGFKRLAETYARCFSVSLEWLLTGKGRMKSSGGAEIVDIWDRIPLQDRGTARRMLEGLARPDERKSGSEAE